LLFCYMREDAHARRKRFSMASERVSSSAFRSIRVSDRLKEGLACLFPGDSVAATSFDLTFVVFLRVEDSPVAHFIGSLLTVDLSLPNEIVELDVWHLLSNDNAWAGAWSVQSASNSDSSSHRKFRRSFHSMFDSSSGGNSLIAEPKQRLVRWASRKSLSIALAELSSSISEPKRTDSLRLEIKVWITWISSISLSSQN
jgi:hypothetical protein